MLALAGTNSCLACLLAFLFTDGFWVRLELVHEMLQPVSDAIHQFECDSPMLSQCLPVWQQLLDHTRDWEEKVAEKVAEQLPRAVTGGHGCDAHARSRAV